MPGVYLRRLDIELTERCNNNCIHCCINLPADDAATEKKELATAQIQAIVREAVSLGCLTLRFTGGEPLLRKDFNILYLYARKLGLKVILFTNATLISPSIAALFKRTPPLAPVEVSVYGMKQGSYEGVTRIPGSFRAARRGIRLLLENKIPFIVKGALLPQNKHEAAQFEKWAATLPGMDKLPVFSMFFDLRCRRDEAKNRLIRRLRIAPEEGAAFLMRDTNKQRHLKTMRQFCAKFMRPPGDALFPCGSGVGSGCVDAYGYFQPCLSLRAPQCVYDLKKGSLTDALQDFFPRLRTRKARNTRYRERCVRCFLKGLCEQCPAKSWTEHGTLDTPVKYLCNVAHEQARLLGLIERKEKAWEVADWQDRIRRFCDSG